MTHTQHTESLKKVLAEVMTWLPFDSNPASPRNKVLAEARELLDRPIPIPKEEDYTNKCVADYDSVEEGLAAINGR